ncbi:MAG: NAD-dependent epimerase/dehydratase family protein [Anaerolineae bacterium]
MSSPRVIAVTGTSSYLGRSLAVRLVQEGHRVIAMDRQPPKYPIADAEVVEIDLQNPLMPDILRHYGVEQLVHTDFLWERRETRAGHERNVVGARNVISAAVAARVRQIVIPSSNIVYGARADNPAFLTETARLRPGRMGSARYLEEIEDYVQSLRDEPNAPVLTVLRFAYIVGPNVRSPLNEMLNSHAVVTLLGFDPQFQVIHEEDAVGALLKALGDGTPETLFDGVVNVAADPPIPLARLLHMAGVLPVPLIHPLAYVGAYFGPAKGLMGEDQPLDWEYLRYPVVMDTKRMETRLGFVPERDSETILASLTEESEDTAPSNGAPSEIREQSNA